jgi:hypothetical protein
MSIQGILIGDLPIILVTVVICYEELINYKDSFNLTDNTVWVQKQLFLINIIFKVLRILNDNLKIKFYSFLATI